MNSIMEARESKAETSLELDKKENGETHISFTLVGTGWLVFNIYSLPRYAGKKKQQ